MNAESLRHIKDLTLSALLVRSRRVAGMMRTTQSMAKPMSLARLIEFGHTAQVWRHELDPHEFDQFSCRSLPSTGLIAYDIMPGPQDVRKSERR